MTTPNLNPPFKKKRQRIVFHEKVKSIITTDKKFTLWTGGRGGGKSFEGSILVLLFSYEKGYNSIIFRYTMSSAEDSIIPEVMEKLEILGIADDFYSVGNKIYNKISGAHLAFKGIKTGSNRQTANLKGISQYRFVLIEEGEEFDDYEAFNKLSKSIRKAEKKGQTQIKIVIIMNPALRSHWVYQKWIKKSKKIIEILGFPVEISTDPKINHIHSTFLDVPSGLSKDWIKEAKLTLKEDPDSFGRDYVGQWSYVKDGVIFPNWGVYSKVPNKAGLRRCLGVDFGTASQTAVVLVTLDDEEKTAYYELLLYQKDLSFEQKRDIISGIFRKYQFPPGSFDTNYPDLTRAIINKTSADIKNAYKKNMVEGGIAKMISYKMLIHEGDYSEDLKLELSLYRRENGKIKKENDHAIDAARYGFVRLMMNVNLGEYNGESRSIGFFGAV